MIDKKPSVVEVYWQENGKLVMCDPLLLVELVSDGHIVIVPTGEMLGALVRNTCCRAAVPRDWFDTSHSDWIDGSKHWQPPKVA